MTAFTDRWVDREMRETDRMVPLEDRDAERPAPVPIPGWVRPCNPGFASVRPLPDYGGWAFTCNDRDCDVRGDFRVQKFPTRDEAIAARDRHYGLTGVATGGGV